MKKLLVFRHESWIKGGHFTAIANQLKLPMQWVKIDQNDAIPATIADDVAGLVFLGGTMSVNDPLPWIKKELDLIRLAKENEFPVLGHCLGSQLISKSLGATVCPMPAKEIGWHTITCLDNPIAHDWFADISGQIKIMLWHHEEFSLPEGAVPLYTSRYCENQAFVFDNMLATVAHIEVSQLMLNHWLEIYGHDITPNNKSIQPIEEIRTNMKNKIRTMHKLTDAFYYKWLAKVYPDFFASCDRQDFMSNINGNTN